MASLGQLKRPVCYMEIVLFLTQSVALQSGMGDNFVFIFSRTACRCLRMARGSNNSWCFDTASANNLPPFLSLHLSHRKLTRLPAVVAQPSLPFRSPSAHWATAATWRPPRSDPNPLQAVLLFDLCLHWHTIALLASFLLTGVNSSGVCFVVTCHDLCACWGHWQDFVLSLKLSRYFTSFVFTSTVEMYPVIWFYLPLCMFISGGVWGDGTAEASHEVCTGWHPSKQTASRRRNCPCSHQEGRGRWQWKLQVLKEGHESIWAKPGVIIK